MLQKFQEVCTLALGLLTQLLPPHQEVIPLAGGKKTIIMRDGYKTVLLDARPVAARAHTLSDLNDMISYAQRAAKPERAVLFCSPGRFVLLLDDVEEPGRERITYIPTLTQQAVEWLGTTGKGLGKAYSHLQLKKFIEDHETDIADGRGILAAVSQFSAKTEMTYSANLGKGGSKSIGFVVQTGQVAGTVELPTKIAIRIPLFEGWDHEYSFEVRIGWSQDDSKQPVFSLEVANAQTVIEEVIAQMVDYAKAELGEGWLIVRGTPTIESNPGR